MEAEALLFRSLVENSADLLWMTDLALRFTYVSPAVENLTGFTAQEMRDRTIQQNLTPASLQRVLARSAEPNVGEWLEEVELIRKDGASVWVEARVKLLRGDAGAPMGFLGVMRDLSQRKVIEAENARLLESLTAARDTLERTVEARTAVLVALTEDLQEQIAQRADAERELRESEARNRAFLAAIPDQIWSIRADGIVVDSWASQVSTASADECARMIGKHVRELMPPASAEQFLAHLRTVLDTGQLQVHEFEKPFFSDTLAAYEARLVAMGDRQVMCIVRNITQNRALMDSLLRSERLATLGQFATMLAHEISNPLQIVQNQLELIVHFALSAEERDQYLETALEEVQRLAQFTAEIMDMASASRGHDRSFGADTTRADVGEVVSRVLFLAGGHLRKGGIQVINDLRITPPAQIAPGHLTQICLNLVMNAIDALCDLEDGFLKISSQTINDRLHLAFVNNGPPIAENSLSRIFEPFYSTKPSGRGLGLWVCHALAQRWDGAIGVRNLAADRGVVFEVDLLVVSA